MTALNGLVSPHPLEKVPAPNGLTASYGVSPHFTPDVPPESSGVASHDNAVESAGIAKVSRNTAMDAPAGEVGLREKTATISLSLTPFDRKHYVRLIRTRGETIRRVVTELKPKLKLAHALDAGCGVGFFAQTLHELDLDVCGFDGRIENVIEARKRFPAIGFAQLDVENSEATALGVFDLVLCFGLLYHLENPMLAIRHLRALTGKALLLESMCVPGSDTGLMLREEPSQDDQSLTDIALYPSESCLVKMLYRAGFASVHRIAAEFMPAHDDFRDTPEHACRRTVLLATASPDPLADMSWLERVGEPTEYRDPWTKVASTGSKTLSASEPKSGLLALPRRMQRFLRRPPRSQYISLAQRLRGVFPSMPIPLRLEFRAWWLAERSALDHELIHNGFESTELRFVAKFLRPGMTVLDIGAHHGLYTLLASKRVGRTGSVIAFEPSPRERRRLQRHVRLNGCSNVSVAALALGDRTGEADLFLVDGVQDWCNSLRPPEVEERTRTVRVEVQRLDDVLSARGISKVDFIKLDVEGAELSFLHGASRLLQGVSRPAILAEVQDIRTRPWGYPAREIIKFLASAGYAWFALGDDGELESVSSDLPSYDANLVALPMERFAEFSAMGF